MKVCDDEKVKIKVVEIEKLILKAPLNQKKHYHENKNQLDREKLRSGKYTDRQKVSLIIKKP